MFPSDFCFENFFSPSNEEFTKILYFFRFQTSFEVIITGNILPSSLPHWDRLLIRSKMFTLKVEENSV